MKRAKSLYYEAIERVAQDLERSNPALRLPVFTWADLDERDRSYQQLLDVINRHALAGIIFGTTPFRFVDTPVLTEPGIPRIAMMTGGSYHGMPRLEFAYQQWMSMAARHLVAHGRKRVAVVVGTSVGPPLVHERLAPLRDAGLEVQDALVQAVTTDFPMWAASTAQLLMRGPASDRPDALIIDDDNLVESATAGLRAAGVSVPNDLTVVAHANLPYAPRAHVPVQFLGYRIDRGLRMCMEHIDAQRAGEHPANVLTLEPEFESAAAESAVEAATIAT
jgi:DNA-binding LacI/PurR family transcriptional regulator